MGTKAVSINTAPASGAYPRLELDGTSGSITLASTISFTTSGTNAGYGVLHNIAGDNVINGTITMGSGNGGTLILSNGGTLTLRSEEGKGTQVMITLP